MDKGTKSYTEYNWDEAVVEYQMDNPEAIDWLKGHIHSHNDFNVFFSGTDWSELNDNCPQHNFYLSLIVNNYLEMTAKIAFTATPNRFSCLDEQGKPYNLSVKLSDDSELDPFMFVYECDIQYKKEEIIVPDIFKKRHEQVEESIAEKARKKAEEDKKKAAQQAKTSTNVQNPAVLQNKGGTSYYPGTGMSPKSSFPDWDGKKTHSQSQNTNDLVQRALSEDFGREDLEDEDTDFINPPAETEEEKFLCYVMRLGNELESDGLSDVLYDMEEAGLSATGLADSIRSHYNAWYDNWFDKAVQHGTKDHYVHFLENCVAQLEAVEEDSPQLIQAVVAALREVGEEFNTVHKQSLNSEYSQRI